MDFVIAIVEISRLRYRAATGHTDAERARDMFLRLDTYDVAAWVKADESVEEPLAELLAELYQIAVRLFGILSLPRSAVSAAYADARSTDGYNNLCARERSELIRLLRVAAEKVKWLSSIQWALIVAGVAAARETEDEKAQDFVGQCIYDIWRHPTSGHNTLDQLEKLQKFWLSGDTEWDECFYEPVVC